MKIVDSFALNLKKLFLVDSAGALLSALLLGVVLANMEKVFGMPRNVLFWLAGIAAILSAYSFFCSQFSLRNAPFWLGGVLFANLTYCILTTTLVFSFYESLSAWGVPAALSGN